VIYGCSLVLLQSQRQRLVARQRDGLQGGEHGQTADKLDGIVSEVVEKEEEEIQNDHEAENGKRVEDDLSTSPGRGIRHSRPKAAVSPLRNLPDLRRQRT
jgi:hypothetical protein